MPNKMISRFLLKHPISYEMAIVWNMIRKSPAKRSDSFFNILNRMPDRGTALDIGANRGQSALTIGSLKPNFSIYSFEPNSACALGLGTVQARLGARLTILFEGLGEQEALIPFFEPCLYGFPLSTEGSFNKDNLGDRAAKRMRDSFSLDRSEFDENYSVRERLFRVSRLDSLGLKPDFIKIDTQGFEVECIKGGRETIDACSPVIVAEKNFLQLDDLLALMSNLSYSPYHYKPQGNFLKPLAVEDSSQVGDIFWLRDCEAHKKLTSPHA